MLEETRLKLTSFSKKDSDKQLEKLSALIADARGPLRAQRETANGKEILYLGVRTWPQYFEEMVLKHLLDMPEKVNRREDETRAAIDRYVNRHIFVSPRNDGAAPDKKHGVELLDKLYLRVYDDEIGADYLSRLHDCEFSHSWSDIDGREFRASKSIRPSRCISVPEGLSVARIASDKIKAGVHIRASQHPAPTDSREAGQSGNLGAWNVVDEALRRRPSRQSSQIPSRGSNDDQDNIRTSKQNAPGFPEKRNGSGENLIRKYCHLLNQAFDRETVVLELASNDESHWVAAYAAAASHSKVAGKKTSIMLVPRPCQKSDPTEDESRLTDREWLKRRARQLGLSREPQKLPGQPKAPSLRTARKNTRKSDVEVEKEIKAQGTPNLPRDRINLEFSDSDSDSDSDTILNGSPFRPAPTDESRDGLTDADHCDYTIVS